MAPSKNTGVNNGGVPARRTGTVNERLAYLFATVHAPDARPYSCPEVARGVAAVGGSVSAVYLKKLLSGERGEPTLRVLRGLADFFAVPVAFFLDEDPEPIDGVALDRQIRVRAEPLPALLAAARQLTDPAKAALAEIIAGLLRAEGRQPTAINDPDPLDPLDPLPGMIADAGRLSPGSRDALAGIIAKLDTRPPDSRGVRSQAS
jgi:transcriptional regulator with XRE-family HTH domain